MHDGTSLPRGLTVRWRRRRLHGERPDTSPVSPAHMNWSAHFPQYFHADGTPAGPERKRVEFADVGCGYGGLLGTQPFGAGGTPDGPCSDSTVALACDGLPSSPRTAQWRSPRSTPRR